MALSQYIYEQLKQVRTRIYVIAHIESPDLLAFVDICHQQFTTVELGEKQ